MKVLLVSEGKHELGSDETEGALAILVRRLIDRHVEFEQEKVSNSKVRVHIRHGKQDGYTKRALAWVRYAEREGFEAMVLVIDQDNQPDRVRQFAEAQQVDSIPLRRALGVAIRTFDAWMLADEQALSGVLEYTVPTQPAPETITDPKDVCARLRDGSDYGMSLTEMYSAVAQRTDLEALRTRCPNGFAPFADRVGML